MTHIIRRSADAAALIENNRTTEYVSYRGLLCRMWNLNNGQGPQFQEVCRGLHSRGTTIPVPDGVDVAKIIQQERPYLRIQEESTP